MWGLIKKMLSLFHPPKRTKMDDQLTALHREHGERAREVITLLEIGNPPRHFRRPQDFPQAALKPPEDIR